MDTSRLVVSVKIVKPGDDCFLVFDNKNGSRFVFDAPAGCRILDTDETKELIRFLEKSLELKEVSAK